MRNNQQRDEICVNCAAKLARHGKTPVPAKSSTQHPESWPSTSKFQSARLTKRANRAGWSLAYIFMKLRYVARAGKIIAVLIKNAPPHCGVINLTEEGNESVNDDFVLEWINLQTLICY